MRSRKRGEGERMGKEKGGRSRVGGGERRKMGGRRRMEEGNIIYSNTYL